MEETLTAYDEADADDVDRETIANTGTLHVEVQVRP